ncbi:terminase large subunit [Bacillus gobiensis]|uniref:terminase large subunit n=1 Tax=Bacillus gobiensis TaxID=1441095 RepID=UPI003D191AE9
MTSNFSLGVKLKSAFGLDFGFTVDPTAFPATIVDPKNREILIFDEIYEKRLLNNEIVDRLRKKGIKRGTILV